MLKVLKGLLQIAPKNEIRYYLNGIHLASNDNGAVTLTASDGSMAAIATMHPMKVSVEKCVSVIACRHSLANILKLFKPKDNIQLKFSSTSVTIGIAGGQMHDVTVVDGRYPDVKRATTIHADLRGTRCTTGIDLNLMGRLAKAGATIMGKKFPCATLDVYDATSPLIFEATFGDDELTPNTLKMALMPARL